MNFFFVRKYAIWCTEYKKYLLKLFVFSHDTTMDVILATRWVKLDFIEYNIIKFYFDI